jgi:hypothetical protein
MARSLPYALGDVVAVPLRDHGFALGVVARADGKGIALARVFQQACARFMIGNEEGACHLG